MEPLQLVIDHCQHWCGCCRWSHLKHIIKKCYMLRSGFSLATSAWPPHTGLGSLPPEGMSLMMFVLSRAHRLTHSGRVLFLYFLVIFLCFYVICVIKASVALEIQIHLAQTEGRIANKMEPPGRASLCSSWSLS